MSVLTDEEIYAMADDGVFLGSIKEITRAIESAVIEKIKARGAVAYRHLMDDGYEYFDAPTGGECPGCEALYRIED